MKITRHTTLIRHRIADTGALAGGDDTTRYLYLVLEERAVEVGQLAGNRSDQHAARWMPIDQRHRHGVRAAHRSRPELEPRRIELQMLLGERGVRMQRRWQRGRRLGRRRWTAAAAAAVAAVAAASTRTTTAATTATVLTATAAAAITVAATADHLHLDGCGDHFSHGRRSGVRGGLQPRQLGVMKVLLLRQVGQQWLRVVTAEMR